MPNAVYLDWAATAPLREAARDAMAPFLVPGPDNLECGANANSLHSSGRRAFAELEKTRRIIAGHLGAKRPDEIVFTSGATEADNAALFGIVKACEERARLRGEKGYVPHLVTSSIEHDAVLSAARMLASRGCKVTYLDPDSQGFIEVRALERVLEEGADLVSVHAVNNEIGSVQPIAQLADAAHRAGALFHTDAVQALGKVLVDVQGWGVDAASFSAHKIGGPKGIGALYLKASTPFEPLLVGGGQESGQRSGTQDVCGSAGFAAACTAACEDGEEEARRLRNLRDLLYDGLAAHDEVIPSIEVERGSHDFAPHIVNVCVSGFESETLILRLDRMGFEVSGGSACSSHSLEPSHVLRALGLKDDLALGSLRVSLGYATSEGDAVAFLEAFAECIGKGR